MIDREQGGMDNMKTFMRCLARTSGEDNGMKNQYLPKNRVMSWLARTRSSPVANTGRSASKVSRLYSRK